MNLVTLTVVVNDWRDTDTSDDNINEMLAQIRHGFEEVTDLVEERFDVAIAIKED